MLKIGFTNIKKIVVLFCFFVVAVAVFAENSDKEKTEFAIKANFRGGQLINSHESTRLIAPGPSWGGEIDIEFPSTRQYPWQQYFGDPTIGVGLVYMNLGADVLGNCVAVYPYFLLPIISRPHFQFYWKAGVGLSFFDKHYWNCDTVRENYYTPQANPLISSVVNVYLNTGLNVNFPIRDGWAVNAEFGYSHMSNGSVINPNLGINMMYGSIGASYTINKRDFVGKTKEKTFADLPYVWSLKFLASGGSCQLDDMDNLSYPIASLRVGATYKVCNWYAVGGSLDAFFNAGYVRQGLDTICGADGIVMSDIENKLQQQHTHYDRYHITEDRLEDKFKVGLALNNEFMLGRLTIMFDFGVYLWDPLRNQYEPEVNPKYGTNRPMFYTYNISEEDGWSYFRLGMRCRVWDNLALSVAVKTHLQRAEFIEWGLAYDIPFMPKGNKGQGWKIYHY